MNSRLIRPVSLVRHLGAWRAPGAGAAWRQLAGALRLLILDGRLPLEARLPGERELAQALDLSRTTVSSAYGMLRDEGFLTGGRGEAVRTTLPSGPRPRAPGEARPLPAADVIEMTS
ncbi:MAG TPA: winged helix-turn-helix domain-containing protein, partial [Brevundimonas sp.]